ncbi:MAG: hypothetical protein ACI9UN_003788 [Granulosicoccus sp.]|jgi:hypothetical protein
MQILKIIWAGILIVLILLAVSSGVTKIMLMQPDASFFGRYGFTNPLMMSFGFTQVLGVVSLVLLVLDGNTLMAVITSVATGLLVAVMIVSWKQR